ncbi:MAG: zinc ribbon domain-containing protein [Thiobacillus sp.]
MSLIKCHECGNEVSTEAKTCPKCGAKVKKPTSLAAKLVVVLIGIGVVSAIVSGGDPGNASSRPEPANCKADDLQCLGDKGIIAAGVYCKDSIERLAKHSVKWTDGTFETKFSRFRWRNKAKGEITYIGDKAEFQNGFGAFTPVVYECVMAADSKTILDARVRGEGRL